MCWFLFFYVLVFVLSVVRDTLMREKLLSCSGRACLLETVTSSNKYMHHTAHNSADMGHVYIQRETKRTVYQRTSQKSYEQQIQGTLTTQL